jgi:chorismate-pyruvate lyase
VESTPPWAALLQRFYSRTGLPLPQFTLLKNEEVPPPYKALLVHSSDMTPTLEGFYQQTVALSVLSRELEGDSYFREVVLRLAGDGRPVEYGVIRIFLAQFPAQARRRVLDERSPLGSILQTEAIAHMSWPQAFFRTRSDAHMNPVLGLSCPSELYGRRNVLVNGARHLLAEVIEVLAPIHS